VRGANLRFSFPGGTFIVYDATQGACYTQAPGYQVLNARFCNSFYSPTDNFSGPVAASGCPNRPRPWMSPHH
jgi:hypothetical protein